MHGLTSVALGLGPQQEDGGLGDNRVCRLVEEPRALSMSEHAWANSLNVCVTLLVLEGGSDLEDGAELCWEGRAGVASGQPLIETSVVSEAASCHPLQ